MRHHLHARNTNLRYWKNRIREHWPHRRWPATREHIRYLVRMCRASLA